MSLIIKNCRFGRGVFADKAFKKGECILTFTGPIISQEQVDNKTKKEQANALQIEDDFYRDLEEPGVFVNHSCNPNAGIQEDKILIARRDIEKGEEIFWDYATSIDGGWTMPCACTEKECRKKVKDFRLLPKKIKETYLKEKIVLNYIVKKYSP